MEATKKVTGKSVKKWLGNNAIIVLMLAVSLIVGIIHPNFFALANIINLFKNVSIRYIIALGISGCLITTGNDLSAGRLAGFAACLACIFAQTEGAAGKFYPNMPTLPTPVVFILVIAICAIVGLCNGLVVSYLKVQPFIATLGMQQVVYGICLVYTGGTPIGSLNKDFTSLASNTLFGVPVLIIIALFVAVCFWFLYNKTRHGKYMYAIGGNEAAAEVAGVNVLHHRRCRHCPRHPRRRAGLRADEGRSAVHERQLFLHLHRAGPCHHRGCCYRYSQVPRKEVISLRERLSGRPLVAVGGPLCYNRLNLSVTADAVPPPLLGATATTAASGGNRESLLGPRPAGCKRQRSRRWEPQSGIVCEAD